MNEQNVLAVAERALHLAPPWHTGVIRCPLTTTSPILRRLLGPRPWLTTFGCALGIAVRSGPTGRRWVQQRLAGDMVDLTTEAHFDVTCGVHVNKGEHAIVGDPKLMALAWLGEERRLREHANHKGVPLSSNLQHQANTPCQP